MKKCYLLIGLLTVMTVFGTGCASPDISEDLDGNDWRTTRAFVDLDWNTPNGTTSLLAHGYDDLCVDDKIGGEIVTEVFLYNQENNSFEYSEQN